MKGACNKPSAGRLEASSERNLNAPTFDYGLASVVNTIPTVQVRGGRTSSVKGPIANILGFVGDEASVITTHLSTGAGERPQTTWKGMNVPAW